VQQEIFMPDYKELYFKMFHASEQAINILIKAQQECEELYISAPPAEIQIMGSKKGADGQ